MHDLLMLLVNMLTFGLLTSRDLRENQLTVLPEGLLSATTELYYL